MISKTFKSVLAAAALAVSAGSLASTDASAWGFHGGGFHGGGFHGGGFHGGGFHGGSHFGGIRPFGGYAYRPRSYVYVGGGSYCGWNSHFSNYWGRCVPNY